MFPSRRSLLAGAAVSIIGRSVATAGPAASASQTAWLQGIAELEQQHGRRLGVAVLSPDPSRSAAYRGAERFPLCSTHKVLSASFVLARVDGGQETLSRRVRIPGGTLLPHSPVTAAHAGGEMAMADLCRAAITVSDNTAANLLLASFGGPLALTAYLRRLGDPVTRLDRLEPALNEATPGDLRDTTTPQAMAGLLRGFATGGLLSAASRWQLIDWMSACETGGKDLRAGLPRNWRVGDKTGSGDRATTNDVALIWPGDASSPVVVTAYYTGATSTTSDERAAALAEVGRLTAALVA